jgi:hypothetical protein
LVLAFLFASFPSAALAGPCFPLCFFPFGCFPWSSLSSLLLSLHLRSTGPCFPLCFYPFICLPSYSL